jgi:hypothetical protein
MPIPRPFTFNSDTNPVGKGQGEYEQWVTYRHRTDEDNSYTRLDFRHEFEYGLADNFDIAVYFANWRYEQTNDGTRTHYDSSSVELVYYHRIEDIVDSASTTRSPSATARSNLNRNPRPEGRRQLDLRLQPHLRN